MKAHRSAIHTTIRQAGGSTSSADYLRNLIRGINARSASCPRRLPSWDLFLVLNFLRGPQCEPLVSCPMSLIIIIIIIIIIILGLTEKISLELGFKRRKCLEVFTPH